MRMKGSTSSPAEVKCIDCPTKFHRRSNSQKRCGPCGKKRNQQHKNGWWMRMKPKARKKHNARARAFYHNLTAAELAEVRADQCRRRLELKLEAISKFGGKCACCGEKRHQFLTIDHVDRDGADHREELVGKRRAAPAAWLRKLKKAGWKTTRRLRVLCHNCHNAIDLWGGCPHAATQPREARALRSGVVQGRHLALSL